MMIDVSNCAAIVAHANCADGIASAMILHRAYPDMGVIFAQYGEPSLEELPVGAYLFCDITPPRSRAQAFVDAGSAVLDHHHHARDIVEMFGDRGMYSGEPGISGAVLACHHASASLGIDNYADAHRLSRLVGIRDTWLTGHGSWRDACAVSEALRFFGASFFLLREGEFVRPNEMEVGHILVQKTHLRASRAARQANMQEVSDVRLAIIPDGSLSSDAAEFIRTTDEDIPARSADALAAFTIKPDHSVVWSLRSLRDGVDVGAFAKERGGGGHVKAAGFTVHSRGLASGLRLTLCKPL